MEDRLLDSLGEHFVYHKLRERFGWTFEQFVDKWDRGVLEI